jgi:hypothetical protein
VTAVLDAPVHRGDPDTSRHAATIVNRQMHGLLRAALLAFETVGDDGLTDFELADWMNRLLGRTNITGPSAGTRRGTLVRLGLVEYDGWRRPSPSGNPSRVHRLARAVQS